MGMNYSNTFKTLRDAIDCAVEIKSTHIVQRYLAHEEYMELANSIPYDVDTVENCMYRFFENGDDAEKFQMTGVWSLVVGSHQAIIDVNEYLDYHGVIKEDSNQVNKLVLKKSDKNDNLQI